MRCMQGSDAREMVMISLVHEHNRTMNAHHAAKRARLSSAPTASQPQLAGAPPGSHSALDYAAWLHDLTHETLAPSGSHVAA